MNYDLVIIGAGPAGLSFACSLRNSGLNIAVIEKQSRQLLVEPPIDGRDIALTHLSRKLMQHHGSWQRINSRHISPIKRAEVSTHPPTKPMRSASWYPTFGSARPFSKNLIRLQMSP
jgi:2-polyprenyl-6-methoxyphenol hydroxylase-like FAD-dependent oxidoreductase